VAVCMGMWHPSLYVNMSRNGTLGTVISCGCNFIVGHIRSTPIALCDSAKSWLSVLLLRLQSEGLV
jgi:hypothetical protein